LRKKGNPSQIKFDAEDYHSSQKKGVYISEYGKKWVSRRKVNW